VTAAEDRIKELETKVAKLETWMETVAWALSKLEFEDFYYYKEDKR